MIRILLIYFNLIFVMFTVFGCTKKPVSNEKSEPPAKISNATEETALTTIKLTPAAETRLGIETVDVELRSIEKNRTYGGEIISVSGKSITITAPLPGTLLQIEDGKLPTSGTRIAASEPLFNLLLTLPQQDILSAQEEVALRQTEYELADKAVNRANQLLDDKAGSLKELEQAQATLSKAVASLKIAETRLELLEKGEIDSAREGLSSLKIRSPIDGIIQKVHVAPGQPVTTSETLLEIVDIDPVWIKVPVYVGKLSNIDPNKIARVHSLGDFTGNQTKTAEPVVASFSADPESATVDLFYEMSNSDLSYRPGQKVSVTLTFKTSDQNLIVPYSAILYDMYGGAWIYEKTEPFVYTRRKVELSHVQDEIAVLTRGPAAGTEVVTAGAAELFGTEFGEGK